MPPRPSPFQRWLTRQRNRLLGTWRRTFLPGDILTLLIMVGLLAMPALALRAAGWADGLLILLPILVVALSSSFFLTRSQFSEISALALSTIYCCATLIVAHSLAVTTSGSLRSRVTELANRLNNWATTVEAGGAGTDNLIFAIFLSVLFWYLAHNSVWHLFRLDRVWLAVLPPGMVLVINHLNYNGDKNLTAYLFGFLFFMFLLLIQGYVQQREMEWRRQRVYFSSKIRRHFLRLGLGLTLIVLLIGAVLPAQNTEGHWEDVKDFLGSDPLEQLSELWSRLFSSLEGQGIATTDYYGGDRLDLSGAVQLGDDPVMRIGVSEQPAGYRYYWRSTVFDTYDGRGWEHQRSVRAYKDSAGMSFNLGDYQARQSITQTIEMFLGATSLVHAAPQPQQINKIAVEAELNCIGGGTNCVNNKLEVDIAIINARKPLRSNDRYTAVSSISVATADQLRSAGTNYPEWVTNAYLQGGNRVSLQTRSLAEQIVSFGGVSNPYDQAKAIEQWLRVNIIYDENISSPPQNIDPVDWFLFETRRGYCNYYATAMVMMLRSQGIPARMAAGFAQGTYEADSSTFLVKENDAHTWVEVFFPGYGWVEFEPTADEQPIDRPGDQTFNSDFPTLTPQPSLTPTEFPTPTFTPTPEPVTFPTMTPTPTQNPIQETPGLTPTPNIQSTAGLDTPTPTPIPPAQTSIEADNGGGSQVMKTLLSLLMILLGVALALTMMALVVIWWVEYRGLGGLNPVQKAYARLEIYGRWLGLRLSNRQTPSERRRVLVEAVPDGERPINNITHLYTHDRFARPQPEDQERAETIARRAWYEARIEFIREKIRRWLGRA